MKWYLPIQIDKKYELFFLLGQSFLTEHKCDLETAEDFDDKCGNLVLIYAELEELISQ